MEKKFRLSGLQLFAAEENTTKTTDLEPAISVDFTSRLQSNITELQNLLGITDLDPVTSGSNIKIYKICLLYTSPSPRDEVQKTDNCRSYSEKRQKSGDQQDR